MSREWESRIVGEGETTVGELLENPWNWRVHSERQRYALTEVLERVGWVQRVIVNRRTGRIVDGHLRVALARERFGEEAVVPVIEVDLSEEEELAVLATLDPIGAMADSDEVALARLAHETEQGWETIGDVLEDLDVWRESEGVTLHEDRVERVPVRRWYVVAVPVELVEELEPKLREVGERDGCVIRWTDEKIAGLEGL